MRSNSVLIPKRRTISLLASFALAGAASAQFNYTQSNAQSDAESGTQIGISFVRETHDPKSNLSLTSNTINSTIDSTGSAGAMNYESGGDASLTTWLTGGGFQADFSTDGKAQILSGLNSYYGPRGDGVISEDVFFVATENAVLPLTATGVVTSIPGQGSFSFAGSFWDANTHTGYTPFTVAAASYTLSPFSTTVSVTAGHTYELSFYELSYMIEPGYVNVGYQTSSMNGSVTLGNPSPTPEPCSLGILGFGVLAAIRRRKSSGCA